MEYGCNNRTCVFAIVKDYGHFAYTTNIAFELHARGYAIEYWSHESARSQCPDFAQFHALTDNEMFTPFYCKESSVGDSDAENIDRMSGHINELIMNAFPNENPLLNLTGVPLLVHALKTRLLQPDISLCVNDKCHVFAWVGEFCEEMKIPVLNLCPSQHELQRKYAGVLEKWSTIFGNITTWPINTEQYVYNPIRPDDVIVPKVAGLYVTFKPLIDDLSLIPHGRKVVGPVYMPSILQEKQREALVSSGILHWIELDDRPIVYVSLGSMVKHNIDATDIKILLKAICENKSHRVLTTLNMSLFHGIDCDDSGLLSVNWVPQFAVLGHPKVCVFVTHCGANSVHESVYHAVPMIAFPFFDDQRYNGPKLVELGLATANLPKKGITEAMVSEAILKAFDSQIIKNLCDASEIAKESNGLGNIMKEAEYLLEFSSKHPIS